jgi:hypothetical protein
MLDILKKILANQLDPNAVIAKLDEIRNGIIEIQESTAPRIIGNDATALIVRNLAQYKGQKAELSYISSDNETRELCVQMKSILDAAGWVADKPSGSMFFGNRPFIGIELSASEQSPAALALLNSLHLAGLEIKGLLKPKMPPDVIEIKCFQKP